MALLAGHPLALLVNRPHLRHLDPIASYPLAPYDEGGQDALMRIVLEPRDEYRSVFWVVFR